MPSLPDLDTATFTDEELGERLARTAARAGALRRRRRATWAAVTLGVAIAVAVGAILAAPRSAPTRTTGPHPSFRLVGEVDPTWRLVGGPLTDSLGLTCPATTTCYATDSLGGPGALRTVEVTSDGGASWARSTLPEALEASTHLVCTDATHCAMLGFTTRGDAVLLETADGGATWTTAPGPSALTSPIGVDVLTCTSAVRCVAVASDPGGADGSAVAFTTTDGGTSWSQVALPDRFVPAWLACPTASHCVVAGFDQSPGGSASEPVATAVVTSDGGASWAPSTVPGALGPLTAGACADATSCVATFFDGTATRVATSVDAGTTFTTTAASGLPDGAVTAMACPTASTCWSVGTSSLQAGGHLLFSSGGRTPIPVAPELFLAGAARGLAARTTDGGDAWRAATLPSGVAAVLDVSCPSETSCYALAAEPASGSTGVISVVLLATGASTPAA